MSAKREFVNGFRNFFSKKANAPNSGKTFQKNSKTLAIRARAGRNTPPNSKGYKIERSSVVERSAVNRLVGGSNPPARGCAWGGFERGQFTVNEAVRQIRDVCTRVMAKKCHLVCGTNDVITNEYRGYVFAPGIQVREPGTDIPKDSSTGAAAKVNAENALSEIQSAILHELRTGQSVSRKTLSGSLQIKMGAGWQHPCWQSWC